MWPVPGTCGIVRGASLESSEVYWKAIVLEYFIKYCEVLDKEKRLDIPVSEETDLLRVCIIRKL